MVGRDEIHEGMVVRSSDGKNLGHVLLCEEDRFVIEKHAIRTVDYVARYDDVADLSGGEILLSRTRDELANARDDAEGTEAPPTFGDEGGGGRFWW